MTLENMITHVLKITCFYATQRLSIDIDIILPKENNDFEDRLNASQRENVSAKAYNIHQNDTPNIINEPIPEYFDIDKENKIIPDETYVLVGFYNNKEQHDWIIDKKKYNFRMGSGNGSLILDTETVSAKYLLLHTHNDDSSSELWRIVSKGPKVRLNALK